MSDPAAHCVGLNQQHPQNRRATTENSVKMAQIKLPTARLGKNGPQVTRLGYGAMGLSAMYGALKPDAERFRVLDTVYQEGDLFWDTADIYGDSEELIGKWFKQNPGKREEVFLATKFALSVDAAGNFNTRSDPEYVREACEKSLKRLNVDYIDLYYCHRLDQKTPIEKTVEALKQLKQEGKIKCIGLSECSSDSLRRACKVEHIDAIQIEYSPFSLDIESEQIGLLKTARELGVAIVAYSPLGRGMLTGQIRNPDDLAMDDMRKYAPRSSPENFPHNLKLVDRLSEIAKTKGCTASQLTLAWILAIGENVRALEVDLNEEEEREIRKACQEAEPAGGRYPEEYASTLYADIPPL
ncbi:hypothetical protein CKM354_000930900 [Cercospora kikuchii]|uniref:NADP-dependent oxidoreductase domain-containing protein n=1 Tax=Cercospora kikuchii TaxID=84275 RepID=A0A9P3FG80_9PEZI|nr:uncharacterized protein CKM354_000930900 [Cercospora kikuchii]GIZ46171.1 hypothetical protein CKM354_000930900 [Cercospora kikuchii]